ncbi:T9SS type A sorting domain-containing protein [Segetibacter sp. 3557_3]|nr:T9SS type A sorting domain-containing protein [Segetibacter sp. 3557_3]
MYTSKGSRTETFQLMGQPSGMYLIRITSKTGVQTCKLVIKR